MVLPSRLSIALVMLVLWIGTGMIAYVVGRSDGQDMILGQQSVALQKYSASTKKVTDSVVTKYVDLVKTIYLKGDTVIKKVPVYVTEKDNSRCVINNGFGRLWNSANKMSVPGSSTGTDADPSPIVLSDIAAQHSREALICHATEQQLLSLQDWVREQSKIH